MAVKRDFGQLLCPNVANIDAATLFRTVTGRICLKYHRGHVISDNYRQSSCSAAPDMSFVRGAQGFVMQQRETRLGAERHKSHADTLTATTPNPQYNQHILTYMSDS